MKIRKLNLGCGFKYLTDHVNCDMNPKVKADYYFNMETDVWPFKDNTFSEIKAYHILEHLGDGYIHAIQEIYRVSKHNAKIFVVVPHHLHEYYFSDPTHKRPITLGGFELFNKDANLDFIEKGWSNSTLGLDFDVNFKIESWKYYPDRNKFTAPYAEKKISKFSYHHVNVFESLAVNLRVDKKSDDRIQTRLEEILRQQQQ